MPITAIPQDWIPDCQMKRIILHWSEGRRTSNSTDREHYHILIEESGGNAFVSRGDHSIADNVSTADDDYAAHTKGCNTGSIGVALCGMRGCRETPFSPGPDPFTREQYNLMIRAVAQLCRAYNIPVTPKTVLAHGEVQENLGIKQNGKWDPCRLPWSPGTTPAEVCDNIREAVSAAL